MKSLLDLYINSTYIDIIYFKNKWCGILPFNCALMCPNTFWEYNYNFAAYVANILLKCFYTHTHTLAC